MSHSAIELISGENFEIELKLKNHKFCLVFQIPFRTRSINFRAGGTLFQVPVRSGPARGIPVTWPPAELTALLNDVRSKCGYRKEIVGEFSKSLKERDCESEIEENGGDFERFGIIFIDMKSNQDPDNRDTNATRQCKQNLDTRDSQ